MALGGVRVRKQRASERLRSAVPSFDYSRYETWVSSGGTNCVSMLTWGKRSASCQR